MQQRTMSFYAWFFLKSLMVNCIMTALCSRAGALLQSAGCAALVRTGAARACSAQYMSHFPQNQQNGLYQYNFINNIVQIRFLIGNKVRHSARARRALEAGATTSGFYKHKDNHENHAFEFATRLRWSAPPDHPRIVRGPGVRQPCRFRPE
jgi:hypothetical protein